MLGTALSVLLVAYVPGALVFRLPVARRGVRARLSAEERVFWYVALSIAASSIVGMGLAAVGEYRFDRLLWITGTLSALIAVGCRNRLRLSPDAPRVTLTALVPATLIVAALALFTYVPPAEYVIGGRDPGVYLNEGIQIAQHGSLTVDEALVASVPAEFRDLFFPQRMSPNYYGLRFMAFFVIDPDQGRVVGQFPHMYPVWIAIAYGINGLSGARQVTVVLAVLGVLALYFLGAWLLGRPAAVIGAVLLTLNVAQVWYSRYPNAEILVQYLGLAAILAYSRSSVEDDRFFAPVAAVLLTLSVLAHFSAVLLVGGIGLAMLVGTVDERRPRWSFVLPLLAGGALVAWYFNTILGEYLETPLGILGRSGSFLVALMSAVAIMLLALLWAQKNARVRSTLRIQFPWWLFCAVTCLAAYAYFFRETGADLSAHDAGSLREFARVYLTPVGLAAAFAGLAVLARRSFWRSLPLLSATLVFACFIFYKIRIIPEHFWIARRFLPIILPATCLLIGLAVAFPLSQPWRAGGTWPQRAVRGVPGLIILAYLSTQFLTATRPIVAHVEYAGVIPRLEAMEAEFADDDLVLIETRDASDLHTLAVPLAYIYARHVLLLAGREPDLDTLSAFLTWARGRYGRILFVGGGGSRILSRETMAIPVGDDRFFVPEYARSYPAVPGEVRLKQYDFGIYELVPRVTTADSLDLNIGRADDLYVMRFHGKERQGEFSFRWSMARSVVLIPQVTGDVRTMTLWLSAGSRPSGLPPATVHVSMSDRLLGAATVSDGFRPYTFAISREHAAAVVASEEVVEITIACSTWSPSDALGGSDTRRLGVMVERLQLD